MPMSVRHDGAHDRARHRTLHRDRQSAYECRRKRTARKRCCDRAQRDERKADEQLLPPRQRKRAVRVRHHHGVIIAVRIQVETVQLRERFIQHAHIIRRDESARFGVVVTAVQIVEARLFVVVVPAITERVDRQNIRATLREDVTPCVVLVLADKATAAV